MSPRTTSWEPLLYIILFRNGWRNNATIALVNMIFYYYILVYDDYRTHSTLKTRGVKCVKMFFPVTDSSLNW